MTPQAQAWFRKFLLAFSESTLTTFLRQCQAGYTDNAYSPTMLLTSIQTGQDGADLVESAMRCAVQANGFTEADGVKMDVWHWLQEFDAAPRADFIAALVALTAGELERRRDPLRN